MNIKMQETVFAFRTTMIIMKMIMIILHLAVHSRKDRRRNSKSMIFDCVITAKSPESVTQLCYLAQWPCVFISIIPDYRGIICIDGWGSVDWLISYSDHIMSPGGMPMSPMTPEYREENREVRKSEVDGGR